MSCMPCVQKVVAQSDRVRKLAYIVLLGESMHMMCDEVELLFFAGGLLTGQSRWQCPVQGESKGKDQRTAWFAHHLIPGPHPTELQWLDD
eukprot:6165886-Amphidinium_carterae.2